MQRVNTQATKYFDRALEINPNDTVFLNNVAYFLTQYSNNDTKALELIDRALVIEPNSIDSMDTKALILDQLGRHQEAIEWYDMVLGQEPKYVLSLNNKGVALSNLGRYQEALVWYDRALEHLPGDLDITSNKARILGLELGKYTEGLTLIKKNLVKNPNHKGLLCKEAEILEKMKDTWSAIPIKEKLKKLYSANYKCGFFKKQALVKFWDSHLCE